MLMQTFLSVGANRKVQYSVHPRILFSTSVQGEEYFQIDSNGHMTKISQLEDDNISFSTVDLSAIAENEILLFLLTPTEADEVPPEARRFLKSGRGTVGIELADYEFRLFAALPNLNGESSYLAAVDPKQAAIVLASQGNFE